MRGFLVDTITTIVFFTIVASLTELFLAGMSPREVLVTRALTVPVMVMTGRPYGLWRDMWFRRMPVRGAIARTALDIAAFLSFQVPVYAMILWIAGADAGEMAIALGAAVWLMVLLSRPFGLVLERVRRAFGLAAPGMAPAPDR